MLGVDKLLFPELGKYLPFAGIIKIYSQQDNHQQYDTGQ